RRPTPRAASGGGRAAGRRCGAVPPRGRWGGGGERVQVLVLVERGREPPAEDVATLRAHEDVAPVGLRRPPPPAENKSPGGAAEPRQPVVLADVPHLERLDHEAGRLEELAQLLGVPLAIVPRAVPEQRHVAVDRRAAPAP